MGKSRRDSPLSAFRNFVVATQQDPSTTEFLQLESRSAFPQARNEGSSLFASHVRLALAADTQGVLNHHVTCRVTGRRDGEHKSRTFRNNDGDGKAASVFTGELEDARTLYDVRTRIGGHGVTRTFKRRKDADAHTSTIGADKLRGIVADPKPARVSGRLLESTVGLEHRNDLGVRRLNSCQTRRDEPSAGFRRRRTPGGPRDRRPARSGFVGACEPRARGPKGEGGCDSPPFRDPARLTADTAKRLRAAQ